MEKSLQYRQGNPGPFCPSSSSVCRCICSASTHFPWRRMLLGVSGWFDPRTVSWSRSICQCMASASANSPSWRRDSARFVRLARVSGCGYAFGGLTRLSPIDNSIRLRTSILGGNTGRMVRVTYSMPLLGECNRGPRNLQNKSAASEWCFLGLRSLLCALCFPILWSSVRQERRAV